MIVDILIIYDGKNITVKSKTANYIETRISNIGLSEEQITEYQQIEFVGESYTTAEMENDLWFQERDKGNRTYKAVDPFNIQFFEPYAAYRAVHFFCYLIYWKVKRKNTNWRIYFGLDGFDVTLKLPNYSLIKSDKRKSFEKEVNAFTRNFKIES